MIELSKEQKDKAIVEIQNYFLNERDEEIGSLQGLLLLDFFMESIGSIVYNQGIEDAKAFMEDKLEDIYGLQK